MSPLIIKPAGDRLVPIPLSRCAQQSGADGWGERGGVSDAAHNITWVQNKGSYLTTTTAELYQFSIKNSDIEL